MWKLALNHVKIYSKQQTVGKISDHELLSRDNSRSAWDNILLAQKINKRGVAIRMSWYEFCEKINSRRGASIPDWRVIIKVLYNFCPGQGRREIENKYQCYASVTLIYLIRLIYYGNNLDNSLEILSFQDIVLFHI